MQAFILETLVETGWRRSGETYWTLASATKAGERLIRRKLARRIRILPVQVDPHAVAEFPPADAMPGASQ